MTAESEGFKVDPQHMIDALQRRISVLTEENVLLEAGFNQARAQVKQLADVIAGLQERSDDVKPGEPAKGTTRPDRKKGI